MPKGTGWRGQGWEGMGEGIGWVRQGWEGMGEGMGLGARVSPCQKVLAGEGKDGKGWVKVWAGEQG